MIWNAHQTFLWGFRQSQHGRKPRQQVDASQQITLSTIFVIQWCNCDPRKTHDIYLVGNYCHSLVSGQNSRHIPNDIFICIVGRNTSRKYISTCLPDNINIDSDIGLVPKQQVISGTNGGPMRWHIRVIRPWDVLSSAYKIVVHHLNKVLCICIP